MGKAPAYHRNNVRLPFNFLSKPWVRSKQPFLGHLLRYYTLHVPSPYRSPTIHFCQALLGRLQIPMRSSPHKTPKYASLLASTHCRRRATVLSVLDVAEYMSALWPHARRLDAPLNAQSNPATTGTAQAWRALGSRLKPGLKSVKSARSEVFSHSIPSAGYLCTRTWPSQIPFLTLYFLAIGARKATLLLGLSFFLHCSSRARWRSSLQGSGIQVSSWHPAMPRLPSAQKRRRDTKY